MAKKDVMIKDVPLVDSINGSEKIPISDGSNEPKTVSISQIKDFVEASEVDLSDYLPREEFEERIEGYALADDLKHFKEQTEAELTTLHDDLGLLEHNTQEQLTELSEEKANKSDVESELAAYLTQKEVEERFQPIGSYATSEQLTELSGAIELRNVGAEDTDESVEEPEIGGGTSSDKQGVVSQTLNYNTADNTYSVSNVVRGSIPSFFIDLVTEAGASFNAESGYFSLNGIDNIAYDEMRQIYDCRTGYGVNSLLAVYGATYTARTNFAAFRGYGNSYANHEPTTIYTKYLCIWNASITKFALCDEVPLYVRAGSGNNFESFGSGAEILRMSRLEEIIGVLDVANLTGSNNFFYNGAWHPWLTSFKLKTLKASIDLSGMPRLSEATILYMINNEKAASAITIKLHADAKAMADASEAIQSALATHTNITLGV